VYVDLIKGYRVTIGGTMSVLKNIERTLHTRTRTHIHTRTHTHTHTHTHTQTHTHTYTGGVMVHWIKEAVDNL